MRIPVPAVTVLCLLVAPVGVADAKKKKKAPKGPSAAFAKRSIDSVLRETWASAAVPPEQVQITFNAPVKVLKARKANPNQAGNVNDAGGKIRVWPVRTNITLVSDDTYCFGTWTNDQWTFYRDAKGKWAFFLDSIDYAKGLPDRYGPNAPCV